MTFDELITDFMLKQHEVFIRYIIRRAKVVPETAEDLAMNAYESALKYKHAYKQGNFTTYMITIVDRVIASYFKHGFNYWSCKDQHTEFVDMPMDVTVHLNLDENIIQRQMRMFISKLILAFKSGIRKTILIMFVEGMDFKDIAKALGKTHSNILSQWSLILTEARRRIA